MTAVEQARRARLTLYEFRGIHAGETAWVFGKGPSFDTFDIREAGPLRCSINDTFRRVPSCSYTFANDSIESWRYLLPGLPDLTVFQPVRSALCACPNKHVIFHDSFDWGRLSRGVDALLNEGLVGLEGSLGSALQVLAIMGVSDVVLVGIDGGPNRARGDWAGVPGLNYSSIKREAVSAAAAMGLPLEFAS